MPVSVDARAAPAQNMKTKPCSSCGARAVFSFDGKVFCKACVRSALLNKMMVVLTVIQRPKPPLDKKRETWEIRVSSNGLTAAWKFKFVRPVWAYAQGSAISIADLSAGRTSMNEEYATYLSSDAWKQKRMQRIAISNFRCAACGCKNNIEVHHLTYARIFNEEMEDLLPLCYFHHGAAEDLVAKGEITRTGNSLFLATETVRLIIATEWRKKLEFKPTSKENKNGARNNCQQELLSQEWFLAALKLDRKIFKRHVKSQVRRNYSKGRVCKLMSNAFAIYNRNK